jgi:hypothetical protein
MPSICDARGHGRGRAKCTMHFDEIVGEIIKGGGSGCSIRSFSFCSEAHSTRC